jgi:hypothetical protein
LCSGLNIAAQKTPYLRGLVHGIQASATDTEVHSLTQPLTCAWCCAGVVKQTLPFDVSQGQPLLLDINNGYLAVLTSKLLVRVFKLAAAEAKPHAGPGQ